MNVDKYFDDALNFEALVTTSQGEKRPIRFLFPIDHTEEMVKDILMKPPYDLNVDEVLEIGYVLRPKAQFVATKTD